jgi:hypothetical protein
MTCLSTLLATRPPEPNVADHLGGNTPDLVCGSVAGDHRPAIGNARDAAQGPPEHLLLPLCWLSAMQELPREADVSAAAA